MGCTEFAVSFDVDSKHKTMNAVVDREKTQTANVQSDPFFIMANNHHG